MSHAWNFKSCAPGEVWPGVPGPEAASLLALQFQLERSQWLSSERLSALQYRQLESLLQHAYSTVPYYRERWHGIYDSKQPFAPEKFYELPILKRREVQARFESLSSTGIPSNHGGVSESRTSGSMGMPIRVLKTSLTQLLWEAIVLREHSWFQRNLGGKLAAIRHGVAHQDNVVGWGSATLAVVEGGLSATLPINVEVGQQFRWLERQQPDFLMSYPSNIAELARTSIELNASIPKLREVRTFGEVLTPDIRELCRKAWDVPVTDSYSSQEIGYIALQCPKHNHYHVQSECVLVEIVDEDGRPCARGQMGRVIVTALHNFAMPLIRYDIGDYAAWGAPCDCGRSLPVLSRIAGRVRNTLVLATGERYWPSLNLGSLAGGAPVIQQQLVQKSVDSIEVRLVTLRSLTADEEAHMRHHLQSRLPAPFDIRFSYREEIVRGAGGKFEEFISEVAYPSPA